MDVPIESNSLQSNRPCVAVLCAGDTAARKNMRPDHDRFEPLMRTLERAGMRPQYAVYHDDFCSEVREQIMKVAVVLAWVNPIEGGRDRSRLDAMLRDVSSAGGFVSAHPDVILKLGTKQVLYDTRQMEWGCDTRLYRSMAELEAVMPPLLEQGEVRVLKRYRGNGGNGIWKVSRASASDGRAGQMRVQVRHALRGSIEQSMVWSDFLATIKSYFDDDGRIVDQPYQERLTEGMVRCYLVRDKVVGFGLQAVNALYPTSRNAPAEAVVSPTRRIYYPPDLESHQRLKHKLEGEWIPQIKELLSITTAMLPVIWDCDFLLGSKDAQDRDTYVLCEINVSSVSPFPDSALEPIAAAALAGIETGAGAFSAANVPRAMRSEMDGRSYNRRNNPDKGTLLP